MIAVDYRELCAKGFQMARFLVLLLKYILARNQVSVMARTLRLGVLTGVQGLEKFAVHAAKVT